MDTDRITAAPDIPAPTLVNAMVRGGGGRPPMSCERAVGIVRGACERCANALGWNYGCDWGYPEGSDPWQRAGGSCAMCEGVPIRPPSWWLVRWPTGVRWVQVVALLALRVVRWALRY